MPILADLDTTQWGTKQGGTSKNSHFGQFSRQKAPKCNIHPARSKNIFGSELIWIYLSAGVMPIIVRFEVLFRGDSPRSEKFNYGSVLYSVNTLILPLKIGYGNNNDMHNIGMVHYARTCRLSFNFI